jgi:hypothetical protein
MIMTDDPKTKILAAVQSQIDFVEQLAQCYTVAAGVFPRRSEFFESTSMAKQTCADLLANVQQDIDENAEKYRLERDISGPFLSLLQKNRHNFSLLEERRLKDEDFILYSQSVELAIENHVAGPIIIGATPTYAKITKILHKIQQDQVRLFNGLVRLQHLKQRA